MPRKSHYPEGITRFFPDPNFIRAGIYTRLSKPDGDAESESIHNQLEIAKNYIYTHPEMRCVKVYKDDGYTGRNFQRPGFQEMLRDIKAGIINCVLVKDTSRFGRNYIQTSDYLLNVFPELGVRFICINNAYDSENDDSERSFLKLVLHTLLDDRASKNLSHAISSSINAQMEKGEFLPAAGSIPYGYLRDVVNNTYIIDEEAAPVIFKIFNLRATGMGFATIADHLNKEGIPCPGKHKSSSSHKNALWIRGTVRKITNDEVYIGNRVHKKPERTTDQNEQIVVKNAHPAIVPEELFLTVREVNEREKAKHASKGTRAPVLPDHREIFRGKLFCKDCGSPLLPQKAPARKNSSSASFTYYDCSNYKYSHRARCVCHYVRDDVLAAEITKALEKKMLLVLMPEYYELKVTFAERRIARLSQPLAELNASLEAQQDVIMQLYDDYMKGILVRSEFEAKRDANREQIALLNTQIENYNEELQPQQAEADRYKAWFRLFMTINHHLHSAEPLWSISLKRYTLIPKERFRLHSSANKPSDLKFPINLFDFPLMQH